MLSDSERLTLRGRNQAFRQEATPRAQWAGARSGSGIFSGRVGVGGHPFAGARRGEGSMEGITALSTARGRGAGCVPALVHSYPRMVTSFGKK